MKRSIALAVLLAMGATSVVASEPRNAWFGGIEVGGTSADFKVEGAGTAVSANDSGGSQSIKVGKYFGKAGRAYVEYTRYNTASSVDLDSYGVGYDYMFYNSTKFIPFAGINLGKFKYKESGLNAVLSGTGVTSSSDSVKISGFTYGLNIGAIYEINKNFDVELGARYIKNNADDTVTLTKGSNSTSATAKIDKIVQYYVGFNYNF